MDTRDVIIRTILGEAANESPMGQAAVAHVIMNRARDKRWPSNALDVALQPKQFSAWNSGAGGNDLVRKYNPGSDPYERAGMIADAVMSGQIQDPTGGAVYYYSPAGMQALVDQGAQSNLVPSWLSQATSERGGNNVTIGGHIFSGLAEGAPSQPVGGYSDQANAIPPQDARANALALWDQYRPRTNALNVADFLNNRGRNALATYG